MADGLIKRGKYWHMDFIFEGRRVQGSTKHTNINRARIFVAKYKANLADERIGLAPAKVSPLFRDFMRVAEKDGEPHGAFLDYVERHAKAKNTLEFYKKRTAQLLKFPGFRDKRLSEIDGELVEKYCAFRRTAKIVGITGSAVITHDTIDMDGQRMTAGALSVNTLNGELKTLRKALKLAEEWGLLKKAPKVRQLPGGKGRDFVVSPALEKLYLEKATYPLKQIATLILDLGLRPEECCRVRKEDISPDAIYVRDGKTKNAQRTLPLTERARDTVALCSALFPDSLYLFPGKRTGTHLTRGAADDRHNALRTENDWPKEFVLHAMRHTFCTRLAESGANPYEIMSAMGHSDIKQALIYIHYGDDSLRLAMKRKEMLDKIMRGEVQDDTSSLSPSKQAQEIEDGSGSSFN